MFNLRNVFSRAYSLMSRGERMKAVSSASPSGPVSVMMEAGSISLPSRAEGHHQKVFGSGPSHSTADKTKGKKRASKMTAKPESKESARKVAPQAGSKKSARKVAPQAGSKKPSRKNSHRAAVSDGLDRALGIERSEAYKNGQKIGVQFAGRGSGNPRPKKIGSSHRAAVSDGLDRALGIERSEAYTEGRKIGARFMGRAGGKSRPKNDAYEEGRKTGARLMDSRAREEMASRLDRAISLGGLSGPELSFDPSI